MGLVAGAWFNVPDLGLVIALAMVTVLVAAALGGILIPLILVRLGVSRDMASSLLDDFRDAVAHFSRHPVAVPMSGAESGGFSHL